MSRVARHMACLASLATSPVWADEITCAMEDGQDLVFTLDRNQFVLPQDPNDPPRRKITQVRYGDKSFPAEPFLLGDRIGFHAEGLGGTSAIFALGPDGRATYANARAGARIAGLCEVR